MLFFTSGATGLIYESLWTHYLKLFLGHSAFAQSLVLVLFMGGLAIGAGITGKFVNRIHSPLLGYALVEAAIGLLAIAFHSIFTGTIDYLYLSVFPGLTDPFSVDVLKWGVATLMILPAATLLGATFPLAVSGLLRYSSANPGQLVSLLYFSNSLGAAIGVLLSGFWLMQEFGLPGTMLLAGIGNNLLAFIVFLLVKQYPTPAAEREAQSHSNIQPLILLLCVSLFTGLASFVYEIAWIRMLSLVLGASTHAFELMLSAFVLGLALGGFWIRNRINTFDSPMRALGIIQLVMGFMALLSMFAYQNSFEWMQWGITALAKSDTGYTLFNIVSHSIALLVMLPTTICAGMTLPLITSMLIGDDGNESNIGYVYAANTFGAILGIVLSVHLLMPVLGLQNLLSLGAAVDLVLGLVLLAMANAPLLYATAAAVIIAAIGIYSQVDFRIEKMVSGVFRDGRLYGSVDPVFHLDGKTSSVDVFVTSNLRILSTNGKPDASIALKGELSPDEYTMTLLAAIPSILNPDAKQAVVIGMGSGITSHILLANPDLEQVITVEIEQGMVEAARFFEPHSSHVFNDPRSKIVVDDAKTYFTRSNQPFDLIVSEPSNPWVSGVASVFSIEFYEVVKRHLSPDGLFVQWMHLYESNNDLLFSVLNALKQEFAHFKIYASTSGDMIIVASPDAEVPELTENTAWFHLEDALSRINVQSIDDIEGRFVARHDSIMPLALRFSHLNSDYFPYLDLNAARARFKKEQSLGLIELANYPLPVMAAVTGDMSPPKTLQLTNATGLLNQILQRRLDAIMLVAMITGNEGAGVSPDDSRQILVLLSDTANCRLWQNSFVALSKSLVLLSPAQLQPAWDALLASPACMDEKPPWIQLMKAINQRDMADLRSLSAKLQEDEQTREVKHFLVMAEVTALVGLGQYKTALERISGSEVLADDQHIALSLLHTHASLEFLENQSGN